MSRAKYTPINSDTMNSQSPETAALIPTSPTGKNHAIPISSVVYALFVMFGAYPYLVANGLWTKLGVFVDEQPEGDSFGAYMGAFIQASNLVTFAWIFYLTIHQRIKDSTTIACMIGISIIDCALLIGLWDLETDVNGKPQSVSLFVMSSICGFVGSTSLMVLWSFCADYPPLYTTAVSIGLGLGGIIPIALDGLQSLADTNTSQQISVFFGLLLFTNILSAVCFWFISSPYHKPYEHQIDGSQIPGHGTIGNITIIKTSAAMIFHQFWNNFLTFCLFPGFQPYLSKGPSSEIQILTWLFLLCNITGRSISSKVTYKNPLLWNIVQSGLGSYLIVEVFIGTEERFPIVAIAVALYSLVNGYHSTLIYIMCYELPLPPSRIGNASRWVAVFGQIGAILGSVIPVILVSIGKLGSNDEDEEYR